MFSRSVVVMRPWRSEFELTVANYSPDDVMEVARGHSRHRFWPGLGVWITRDGDLRARSKEWGSNVTAPVFTGRLTDTAGSTRIVGSLTWTQLQCWQLTYGICAAALVISGLGVLFQSSTAGWIVTAAGLVFLVLFLVEVRTETATRAAEEERLKISLTAALSQPVPSED